MRRAVTTALLAAFTLVPTMAAAELRRIQLNVLGMD